MKNSVAEKVRKMRQRAKTRDEIEPAPEPEADEGKCLSLRVGCELLAGDGWIRQVLMNTSWPLAVLRIGSQTLGVTSPIFGAVTTVSWDDATAVEPTLLGVKITYTQDDSPRELRLYRPFLWSRLVEFANKENLKLPIEN